MSLELIKALKDSGVVVRKKLILSQGDVSDHYFDIKKAYGRSEVLELTAREMLKDIDGERTTCIASSGYGGIPLATAISQLSGLKLTLVRGNPREYGLEKSIEGYVPTFGDKVSIVDDVFTTGGNLRNIMETIRSTGADILDCHVVVKRGKGGLRVPLIYLLAAEELL
tara:strand:+ start:10905 stop:11408 length:504 start_codon:yes stop_codon:yes gene_type:complete